MFINKFYDKIFELDNSLALLFWLVLGLVPAFIFFVNRIDLWWMAAILIIILAEWAFIDYIRQTKNKQTKRDIIFTKIGYIFGTFPFVFVPLDIYIFRHKIASFLNQLAFSFISWNWILILQSAFWVLTGIFFVTIYFIVNIRYASKKNKIK